MKKKTLARAGIMTAGAAALTLGLVLPAAADYAPGPGDIVGVGGDTPQFDLSFFADGDANGDPGFNSSTPINRLVTFNATADANARQAYTQGSTESTPLALNPTVVLRAGTNPVQRVPSSGAAINALLADTGTPETINFIFSASEPTQTQQNQAGTNGWGYLHVVQIATDSVQIAADSTTNAPSGLSVADLLGIYKGTYTTWNQIPGNSGGSTATIVPELPPSTSAIYKTFLADLTTANGGTKPALSSSVITVEQNDPSAITGNSSPADAIVPFSSARLNLDLSGYFHNPATAFPGSGPVIPTVKALTATPPDGGSAYNSQVNHYVIFRQSDATSATPMEPGGTKNWVQTLFSNNGGAGTPAIASNTYKALITASGATPAYNDLGNVSSGP